MYSKIPVIEKKKKKKPDFRITGFRLAACWRFPTSSDRARVSIDESVLTYLSVCPQSFGQRRSSGCSAAAAAAATGQQQSAAASCAHRRPSMPQTKRTCQQPTFVHQDELWLTQTQRHANRSPPPVTRGLLNNNVDSPTDDGTSTVSIIFNGCCCCCAR